MMPTISLYPDPPIHGQQLSVSTNGTLPKKLKIDGDPAGSAPLQVTLVEAKETITLGNNCVGIKFHDDSGECPDESRVVL